MANESGECPTCGGDRFLIGDKADRFGERADDVQPCPDCNADADDFNDRETSPFDRADYGCEADAFIERRFDFGGEA